jgi:peroxiredoxin
MTTTFDRSDRGADRAPRWISRAIWLAGIYNLVWGAFVVLFPQWPFHAMGLEQPVYPAIWQCVGMIVGVYGVGYLIAARNPARHWPIILVGLLGKIFGPIGFVMAASRGELPWIMGFTIITNDLIWWYPFAAALFFAGQVAQQPGLAQRVDEYDAPSLEDVINEASSHDGRTLADLSRCQPTLVTFLRHAGCTFCKEALADLKTNRTTIEDGGIQLALVHMGPNDSLAEAFFKGYGMADVPRFSDPQQTMYRAFGLERGSLHQLFGPKVWMRGLNATLRGHRVGKLEGDGFQMPGTFLIDRGQIVRSYRHRTAADRPDYARIACVDCGSPSGSLAV